MDVQAKNINQICNFYINEWHLVTAILPYVAKLIENKVEIEAYCENSINKNIEVILSRINIKNTIKQKIQNINFEKTKYVNNISLKKGKKMAIIVSGSEEYIRKIDEQIEKNIINNSLNKKEITIVNCYDISNNNINTNKVLKVHNILLKTSGEIPININDT